IGRSRLQREADDRIARCAARHRNLLDAVRSLTERDAGSGQRENPGETGDPRVQGADAPLRPATGAIGVHFFSCVFWSACSRFSVLERSDQSPEPSCTSSFSLIPESVMSTITP